VEHGERLRSNGFEESAVRGIKLLHRRRRQTGANTPAGPDTALPRLPRELQSHLHDVQGPQISRFVAEPLCLTKVEETEDDDHAKRLGAIEEAFQTVHVIGA